MNLTPNRVIVAVAGGVVVVDQVTKWLVLKGLSQGEEMIVVDGFFRLVHWTNTGAAWSSFRGYNDVLAIVGLVALLVLYLNRHHFEAHTSLGQFSLGLVFGGIVGNLVDRLVHKHVVDFLYFYLVRREGSEAGFPAFNVADAAICAGVALVFLASLRNNRQPGQAEPSEAKPG